MEHKNLKQMLWSIRIFKKCYGAQEFKKNVM